MKLYRHKEWKAYCAEQIKLHGGVCAHCLRSGSEVVLQVHHTKYVKGRLPWEYPYDECEVLCRGCHAKVHGIIKPSKDWELIGQDDLGGLNGECEQCGKELRYAHMVSHPNWGVMIVGEQCCDHLTDSTVGTESHADFLNYLDRRKRFITSEKWCNKPGGVRFIKRAGIRIEIAPTDDGQFRINLNGVHGRVNHSTYLDAQISAFDFVESGAAEAFLAKRRRKVVESLATGAPRPTGTSTLAGATGRGRKGGHAPRSS